MELVLGVMIGMLIMHVISRIMMWWAVRSIERDLGMSMEDILKQAMDESKDAQPQTIDAEYAEGEIFFYASNSGLFLAKGRTFDEVMQRYNERFGEQKILVRVPSTDSDLMGLIPKHHME
jgi:hypothetical protein